MKPLGQAIKEIRKSKGISAKFVADSISVSPSAYSRMENGSRSIKAELLPLIADSIGVRFEVFFDQIHHSTHLVEEASDYISHRL